MEEFWFQFAPDLYSFVRHLTKDSSEETPSEQHYISEPTERDKIREQLAEGEYVDFVEI